MRIRVDEIPESGRVLHVRWDQERLDQFLPEDDPFDLRILRPLDVDLEIDRRSDHIHIGGAVTGGLQMACHRCLKPTLVPLDERVEIFLVEEQKKGASEEETELEPEDLEYELFDGEEIDLDQLIAEQVFLALPFKVLCSEACRGLCPRCGSNLNEESCRCGGGSQGSPFSRLETIKDRLPSKAKPE